MRSKERMGAKAVFGFLAVVAAGLAFLFVMNTVAITTRAHLNRLEREASCGRDAIELIEGMAAIRAGRPLPPNSESEVVVRVRYERCWGNRSRL